MLRPRVQSCWQMVPTVTCNTGFSLQALWTQLFKRRITRGYPNINHYPLWVHLVSLKLIHWIVIYPVDSAIQCLNNWGQNVCKYGNIIKFEQWKFLSFSFTVFCSAFAKFSRLNAVKIYLASLHTGHASFSGTTSPPGRFSLLQSQGKAPWGRGCLGDFPLALTIGTIKGGIFIWQEQHVLKINAYLRLRSVHFILFSKLGSSFKGFSYIKVTVTVLLK